MELLVTIAYLFLIRLVFYDFGWLKMTPVWGMILTGIWCSAAMTEIVFLGQYTPYTKRMFVTSYVLQIAPEYGGFVEDVNVSANVPVKKGDPLFSMDKTPWEDKVAEFTPQVATAQRNYDDARALVKANVGREVTMVQRLDELNALKAELADAQYKLDNATVYAPMDGYVINLQLRPGVFIRLKQPVMTFVSSENLTIVGEVPQVGSQWIESGDVAEVAFDMYPGMVFPAEVEHIIFGSGNAQFTPSGTLPALNNIVVPKVFALRLKRVGDFPDHPLRFGSSGIAAIYSNPAAGILRVLRKIEIRSESYLNYIYNPF